MVIKKRKQQKTRRDKIKISKKRLYKLYVTEDIGLMKVASIFGVCAETICKRLDEFGIAKKNITKKLNISKRVLNRLYNTELKSSTYIAKQFGCSFSVILKKLKEYNIKIRTASEATKNLNWKDENHPIYKHIPKNELVDLYINKEFTLKNIGNIYNCSDMCIRNKLRKYGIKIRNNKEASKLINRNGESNPNFKGGMPKCEICGKPVKNYGRKMCRECFLSTCKGPLPKCIDCGKELSGHAYKRCEDCNKKSFRGKGNPRYIDGRTDLRHLIRGLEEYSNWRLSIFKRDNFTCLVCGNTDKDYLEAHHLKPYAIIIEEFLHKFSRFSPHEDKETLLKLAMDYDDFWKISNGQTMCYDCHLKENKNTWVKIKNNRRVYNE